LDENARNNLKHLIRLVINKRLEAILKAGEAGDEIIYERLTPEERVLLKNIKNLIRNWIEYTGVENP
jgi:DNA replication initiation complex subunit (GINS family)